MRPPVAPLILSLFCCACAAEVDRTTVTLALTLPETCAVGAAGGLGPLDLRVTGDFVSVRRTLRLGSEPAQMSGLPADGRHLVVQADDGVGAVGDVVLLSAADLARPALLLPLGRPCALSEGSPTVAPGAAVVTLPDGALLSFGGHDADGVATDTLLVRRPGTLSLTAIGAHLAVPRTFATATRVGGFVVVAGGGAERDRLVYDSYEVFDLETERFVPELRGTLEGGARSGHAAVALVDGRVLLAGGVGVDSQVPTATAELIDPLTGQGALVPGGLSVGRRRPTLLRMRSGIVLLLGGDDVRGVAVAEAEWFDPGVGRFMPTGASLQPFPRAAALRLVGERVAWFGCDPGPAQGPCGLQLLLPSFEVSDVPLERKDLGTAGLDDIWLESPGGSLLRVRGRDADGQPHTYTLDLDTDALTDELDRAVGAGEWLLSDGVRLLQDATGARMRREGLQSPYDDPATDLLDPANLAVVLDARRRWNVSEAGLLARAPQARFDVPGLRFERLRASIEVDGAAELLLSPDGSPAVPVSIEPTQVAIGGCAIGRAEGFPVEVQRSGTEVVLQSAGERRRCEVGTLVGPLEIGVRAGPGSRVESFSLRRR